MGSSSGNSSTNITNRRVPVKIIYFILLNKIIEKQSKE